MLDLVKTLYDRLDTDYAQKWMHDTAEWEEDGLYEIAAEIINLKAGEAHLDIGSGLGMLLVHLKKRIEDSALIGVDRNIALTWQAMQFFTNLGLKAVIMGKHAITVRKDGCSRLFEYDKKFNQFKPLTPGQSIHLIIDDIRKRKFLDKILKGQKVDSMSFILPGVSLAAAFETPFGIDTKDENELRRRINTVMLETRGAVYGLAAKHLKTSGRFVTAERLMLFKEDDRAPADLFAEQIEAHMGTFGKYFIFDTAIYQNKDTIDGHVLIDSPEQSNAAENSPSSYEKQIDEKSEDILYLNRQPIFPRVDLFANGIKQKITENSVKANVIMIGKFVRNDQPFES